MAAIKDAHFMKLLRLCWNAAIKEAANYSFNKNYEPISFDQWFQKSVDEMEKDDVYMNDKNKVG